MTVLELYEFKNLGLQYLDSMIVTYRYGSVNRTVRGYFKKITIRGLLIMSPRSGRLLHIPLSDILSFELPEDDTGFRYTRRAAH